MNRCSRGPRLDRNLDIFLTGREAQREFIQIHDLTASTFRASSISKARRVSVLTL
jgi:hypothetical protein